MWFLLLPLALQSTPARQILDTEIARADDVAPVRRGIASRDVRVQRLAVRAAGRLERPSLQSDIEALLGSPNAGVRMETINALAQMHARYAFAGLLQQEKADSVRGALYEAIGRAATVVAGSEAVLVQGLSDAGLAARTGAARGLESFIRLNARTLRPGPATVAALRTAVRTNQSAELRELALLALNAAQDHDSATMSVAMRDTSAQVRRLAVIGTRQWVSDPSPMVRYEAMRLAGNCERAIGGLRDPSELVVLEAVDVLGARACDAAAIEPLVTTGVTWRIRAHALVALARIAPANARAKLPLLSADSVWQVRMYAATAAKLVKDDSALAILARDPVPNVAAEALTSLDDAVRALASDHAGLLLAAAHRLANARELPALIPQILATLDRLTRSGRATLRDPRLALIARIREGGDAAAIEHLRSYGGDPDPAVAALAAESVSSRTGVRTEPYTMRYAAEPAPADSVLAALRGATARITMRGLGTITVTLLTDEAPVAVATFAATADRRAFDGLTFHRVVPNFVIQGGSPGADEYDGMTSGFMRDEIGLARNVRGSLGISTRGRDTGDGQFYVNLVDNFRLDHDYTIFARVIGGMDVVDRILEGAVIESIRISRTATPRK